MPNSVRKRAVSCFGFLRRSKANVCLHRIDSRNDDLQMQKRKRIGRSATCDVGRSAACDATNTETLPGTYVRQVFRCNCASALQCKAAQTIPYHPISGCSLVNSRRSCEDGGKQLRQSGRVGLGQERHRYTSRRRSCKQRVSLSCAAALATRT